MNKEVLDKTNLKCGVSLGSVLYFSLKSISISFGIVTCYNMQLASLKPNVNFYLSTKGYLTYD